MTLSTQQIGARLITSPVFDWNYESRARTKVNQGGSSSGKTFGILQVIFCRLTEKRRVATVVGETIPHLKKGALRDFQDTILGDNPWMNHYIASYNKTDRKFTFINGSILEFNSYQDAQDAKGARRDILYINEANGVAWPIFEQLEMRTREEVFIDYNPTAEFWAHERVIPRQNAVTFYSNFTHNPFLDDVTREYLLSLKDTDYETWLVYGLGKTGAIAELVHEKITIVKKMPRYLKRRGYGLDFGYRANPSALVECGLKNERDLYIDERFYVHRMKTADMAITMKMIGINRQKKIFADPADGRAIDDLSDRGWRMIGAVKGQDSVSYGIQLLNQYNLFVTERSLNLINEQKRYRHKTDKNTGKIINDVVKAWNHGWDATRYYGVMNLKPIRKINSRWRGAVA